MKPLVSVIIPVLNRKDLVERSLDSIYHQSYENLEIIIIDNGSEDGTPEKLNEWSEGKGHEGRKIKIDSEPERGAWAARQKGYRISEGKFLIFFDSDDEMKPELVERAMDAFLSNQNTDIVCWPCELNLLSGKKKIPRFNPKNALENHLIDTLLRPQGYMVEKSFFEKSGGWNKKLPVWNDLEIGLRLILLKPSISVVKEVLAVIHSLEDSITGKDFSSKEGQWERTLEEMKAENSRHGGPDKEWIDKILTYREVVLASQYSREGNSVGSSKLLKKAISRVNGFDKLILKASYLYTRMGGRGAWRVVRYLI